MTGGNSGIRRAAAILFVSGGANVAVAAKRRQELDDVVAEIEGADGRAIAIPTDISAPVAAAEMMDIITSEFGRLDAAFNNAGATGKWGAIDTLDVDDFDKATGINLRGTFLCVKAEVARMRVQGVGGAIVNTSSWLSQGAMLGSVLYSMTKAVLDAMTRALSLECAELGIRINNVSPGVVDTPMTAGGTDEQTLSALIAHTPTKRLTTADEIAEAAIWLCSPRASGMTGQAILVDGGYAIPGNRF